VRELLPTLVNGARTGHPVDSPSRPSLRAGTGEREEGMIQPSGDRKRVTIVMSEKERDRLVRFLSQALKTMPSSVPLRMTVNSIRMARVASWGRRRSYVEPDDFLKYREGV